jgi:hypothetical protein
VTLARDDQRVEDGRALASRRRGAR